MGIIQSLYTHLFRRDGKFYVYNSLSGLFAEMEEPVYRILYDRTYDELSTSFRDELIAKKVLIEADEKYQYYYESLLKFRANAHNSSVLGLVVVVPTTSCNFDCPYCFEGEKCGKFMTDAVQEELINFVARQTNLKTINLTWYGGEPLLAIGRIKSLYKSLSEIDGVNIEGHSMLTNGYLINSEVIEFMKESRLRSLQITIDGNRENHNKTRFLKATKAATYDRIIENIVKVATLLPDCHLSVRVNINRSNQHDFVAVIKEIYTRCAGANVSVYPGIIREETRDDCSMKYSCIHSDDYIEFLKDCEKEGISVNFFPRKVKARGCMLSHINSYIVGPEGELYKCWNDVNHPEKIIGYIHQSQLAKQQLFYHYLLEATPFALSECKNCMLFPVCSGGCGHYLSRNLLNGAKYDVCPTYKDTHILEEVLLSHIQRESDVNKDNYDLSIR